MSVYTLHQIASSRLSSLPRRFFGKKDNVRTWSQNQKIHRQGKAGSHTVRIKQFILALLEMKIALSDVHPRLAAFFYSVTGFFKYVKGKFPT